MYKYIQMHICIRKHTETRYKYFYTHTCTHISDTQSHICVFITHTQTHSHTHSHTYTHTYLSHDPLRSNEDTQPRRDAEGLLRALHTYRRKINIKKKNAKNLQRALQRSLHIWRRTVNIKQKRVFWGRKGFLRALH